MNIASIVGLVLAVDLTITSIMLGEAPFTAFLDLPSMLVVFVGAVAAAMICFFIGSADRSQRTGGRALSRIKPKG